MMSDPPPWPSYAECQEALAYAWALGGLYQCLYTYLISIDSPIGNWEGLNYRHIHRYTK